MMRVRYVRQTEHIPVDELLSELTSSLFLLCLPIGLTATAHTFIHSAVGSEAIHKLTGLPQPAEESSRLASRQSLLTAYTVFSDTCVWVRRLCSTWSTPFFLDRSSMSACSPSPKPQKPRSKDNSAVARKTILSGRSQCLSFVSCLPPTESVF